ncbi:glucosamine-6-phosphate isomerase [Paenibacillus hemerocallicola]|uniref:Glucosamine-6-phosphate isomerase n=1 Tax=Paenibacillus hemerocallicola TaxID=1172614 RepID=A0A5C4TCD6_9BACL|nr:glucosamine-6-phosphate isomerase [Paenibacillus hemerocallicola]TNJ66230.1 glucosamine-6-phosphate isomerase [Paenibacillus hemerocallicola]
MNLFTTLKGSLMESFFPNGWDLQKIDRCAGLPPAEALKREPHWNDDFRPVSCSSLEQFDTYMGHEIALLIKQTRDRGEKLAIILPVGPMGMYKWTVYFLKAWNVSASHVHGFNMDEWSDAEGNTLPPTNPGSFQYAMENSFYDLLGDLTVPSAQRNFATKENLPSYKEKIACLRSEGAKLAVVYGIGRVFHIAFWEPHFAGEYGSEAEWRVDTHRIAAQLHPLTIEQNAITSFKSRTTLVPCYANTIGPGLFLQADYAIGGADGALGRGMMWQGMSLLTTLKYGPDPWVPSSYMPTIPGKLFFLQELAGPLEPELN